MDIRATILGHVEAALAGAISVADIDQSTGQVHAARSRNFVESLAQRLRDEYERGGEDVAVLSKHYAEHRQRLGTNELLFDILVCQTREVPAAVSKEKLTVVTKGLLAVESELAKSSREAIYDFNKLVLCAAEDKLFIGPCVADERAFLRPLGVAASHCAGRVFAVFVPHPEAWRQEAALKPVVGYQWQRGEWVDLASPALLPTGSERPSEAPGLRAP